MRRVETTPLPPVRDYAYYHQVLAGVQLPAALIDLDALTINLQCLGKRAGQARAKIRASCKCSMTLSR